ncbi:uracil-DNA glycosylase family protein [Chitinolyticbacter albus]|uniref:uracil-DNA glycosylase family protein n=1 Tax=Chitinolyticbacter albus TaxID=2961951 RepID=UPI002109FD4E|nr:uracil-DNA glycosylase family protein [Chitinolyticbacter albus]
MQPRVLHLLEGLGLSAGQVPCSNLVFVRSRRESDLKLEMRTLADLCWPFHSFVIQQLRPSTILCFGKTAGQYVRGKIGAKELCGEFVEDNNRKWRSTAYVGNTGLKVVVATHPSIADWRNPATDPTSLVRGMLQ